MAHVTSVTNAKWQPFWKTCRPKPSHRILPEYLYSVIILSKKKIYIKKLNFALHQLKPYIKHLGTLPSLAQTTAPRAAPAILLAARLVKPREASLSRSGMDRNHCGKDGPPAARQGY